MRWWEYVFPNPRSCWFCSAYVSSHAWSQVWDEICPYCQQQIKLIADKICHICGRKTEEWLNEICLDCSRIDPTLRVINRSVVCYTDWIKQIIHTLKYRGDERLSVPLGRWMAEKVERDYVDYSFAFITYVPLSVDRLQIRCFNQAQQLAKEIGKVLQIPVMNTLERKNTGISQSRLTRRQRLQAPRGHFQLSPEFPYPYDKDQFILLVDDIYTTGTTIRECAKPLRRAGYQQICSMTFAR